MMSTSTTKSPKRVVIVGGSFAGLCTARHLSNCKDISIHLIEPKNYFEYTPGILHVLSGSNAENVIMSPIQQVLPGKTQHIRGLFNGINTDSNTAEVMDLNSKQLIQVPYDILVIASGVKYTSPIRPDDDSFLLTERKQITKEYQKQIHAAKNIIIAGGGLVGVEMAAEIVHRFKREKNVILISRSPLLGALPHRAGKLAHQYLERHGVQVVIGSAEKCEVNNHNVITKTGEVIHYDLLIECGSSLVKNTYEHSLSKATFRPYDSDGFVPVNQYLQSINQNNIFSCGDCIKHETPVGLATISQKVDTFGALFTKPPVRNAHLSESQAEVVAHNIRAYAQITTPNNTSSSNSVTNRFISYPSGAFQSSLVPVLSCVSLGPNDSIIIFNQLVIGGFLLSKLGGLVKFIIERTKIAEIRNRAWGRAFWAFGHVVVNLLHRFIVFFTKRAHSTKKQMSLSFGA